MTTAVLVAVGLLLLIGSGALLWFLAVVCQDPDFPDPYEPKERE